MERLLCVDDDAAELRGTTMRLPHQLARRTMRRVRLSGRHMRISPGQLHGPRPVLGCTLAPEIVAGQGRPTFPA